MPVGPVQRPLTSRLTNEPGFTKKPIAAAVDELTTPKQASPNVEAEGRGILGAIGDSMLGRAMLGAAGAMAVLSPMTRPILEAHAAAPERLAADQRTSVSFLQARAESMMRAALLQGRGQAVLDDAEAIAGAVDKRNISPAQGLRLAHDVQAKRGFTAEALAVVTNAFSARSATLAAPLVAHKDSVGLAPMRGDLANVGARFDDVVQGAVGDCYFAASAAAIVARDPSFPHRVIEERKTIDGDRFYAVQMSRNLLNLPQGTFTVEVQDSVWSKDGADIYGKNTGGHWFQVLEQAAAKLDGNYDKLESGFGFEGMSRLTGLTAGYAFHFAGADREAVFANVKKHFDAGNAMTTGSHAFADKAFVDAHPDAFATMHEYAIVSVRGDDAQTGEIDLYNPWGHTLTVSVEEFTRNFLGFSFLDLDQEKPPVQLAPAQPAIVRREDDRLVVDVKRPVAMGDKDPTV